MIQLYYLVFCLALAFINYKVIDKGLRVYHALNGLAQIAAWIAAYLIVKDWIIVTLPFIGRLFFDLFLNALRNIPLDYVPLKPKAIMDKMEIRIFGRNGVLPKLVYLVIIITLNVIYYATN